jgi:hypothetical protein
MKKPAEVRIQWRGVAGVVEYSMIQPASFVNHGLNTCPRIRPEF